MLWSQIVLSVLEQYLQWRYGPLMAVGLFLLMLGIRIRNPNALCVGGILVVLVVLSMH